MLLSTYGIAFTRPEHYLNVSRKCDLFYLFFEFRFGKLCSGKGRELLADTCNLILVLYKIICVNMYHLVYLGIIETFRGSRHQLTKTIWPNFTFVTFISPSYYCLTCKLFPSYVLEVIASVLYVLISRLGWMECLLIECATSHCGRSTEVLIICNNDYDNG